VIYVAHGLGGVRDLPIPMWMLLWGAAIVLVLSFVLLGALWKRPLLERLAVGRSAPAWLSAFVLARALRVVLQLVSAGLLALVFAAALVGDTDPFLNLAPTWIYVIFWLGVPALSVLFGNVWRALSPWRAIADGAVWAWELTGRRARPLSGYPEQFGRWPAAVLLFAFAALELVYSDPSSPRALAFAIALYTYVTLFGFAAFGRETWTGRGEAFAVLFGYFARISAFAVRDGRLLLRWPPSGLGGAEPVPGSVAFLAVMLGTVAFDGFSRSSQWQNLLADIEGPYVLEDPDLADLIVSGVNLLGMLGFVLLVAGTYLLACAGARSMVEAPRSLVPEFLLGLVPIAFVYVVAHYFSYFVIYSQFAIPQLSDPFGKGWDLLGSADYQPNLAPLTPNTVWWVQWGALVTGHVVGLAVAHDRAVAIFRDRGAALRSQYAMLALMVLYTVGGLWLLSRG
jgi:hypothetical protein